MKRHLAWLLAASLLAGMIQPAFAAEDVILEETVSELIEDAADEASEADVEVEEEEEQLFEEAVTDLEEESLFEEEEAEVALEEEEICTSETAAVSVEEEADFVEEVAEAESEFELEAALVEEIDEAMAVSTTYSGTCGDSCTWTLADGVLTISGTGEMTDYEYGNLAPWYSYYLQITSIVVESGITHIGSMAFYRVCASSVSLPSTVTSLGERAFGDCHNLTSVTLPSGVTAISNSLFNGCSKLTKVKAPGAKSYGDYAFTGTAITTFAVGKKVTSISGAAFYKLNITAYTVESGNSTYTASNGVLYTNSGKTLVLYPAGSTDSSFTIPDKVTKISSYAFAYATNLKSITFGAKVKTLESYAFFESGLTSVTLPDTVTSVGQAAFKDCRSLKKATFGTGLTEASDYMFAACTALTTIHFGTSLTTLGDRTFDSCTSLTSVTLPKTITSIGESCFANCTSLTSFTSKGLTSIPYGTFEDDTALTTVSLNKGLTHIYRKAFSGCTALTSVTLPSTIVYVHGDAFETTTSLGQTGTSLTSYGTNGLIEAATVTVSGTRDYTKAYEFLELVNKERTAAGLSELVMNESLLETAMLRAAENLIMFGHTRPDGTSCFTADSLMAGENCLASASTAAGALSLWRASPGHWSNILGSDYTTTGIGCFTINGNTVWVQCFGRGSDTESCAKPANTSVKEKILIPTYKGFSDIIDYTLTISLASTSIAVGKTTKTTLCLGCLPESVQVSGLTLTSSDPSVATVNKKGVVTGVSAGTATIYYKSGSLNASVTVTVTGSGTTTSSLSKGKISSLKNTSSGVKIKWSRVSGASGYYIYRKTSGGSYKKIKTIKSASTLSYTDTAVKSKNGTTYTYKVVPYKGSTKGSGTAKTVVRLTGTSLKSVKNSSTKKAVVKWTKVSAVSGYQIQYSTSSSFAKNKKTKTVSGASSVKKTLSGLTKGKTYYVRIRTYKTVDGTKYYSAWSSSKKVKISK